MSDEEIINRLIEDAQEFELDFELDDFINNNLNLTAIELDEQFRNEWNI